MDEDTVFTIKLVFAGLAALAVIFGAVGLIWTFSTASAPIRGKAAQYRQVNSAENRTYWYEKFYKISSAYDGEKRNIFTDVTSLNACYASIKGKPDPFGTLSQQCNDWVTDLTGSEQACSGDVADYNTSSNETLIGAQFKDTALPASLDASACTVPVPTPPTS